MRKGQNRKVKFARSGPALAGRAGCLGLLALGLALVNPVGMSASAFAEGEDGVADDVAPLADTPSTVGISFSPARYYAELSPTDDAGQSARIDLQTTIYVYNSGGYSVYLKSDNPNLVGEKNSSNFIPGATIAKSYTDMDVNTWGYAWATDAVNVSNDATYKAVVSSGNGDKLAENTSNDIEVDTKTIALSFATKINDEMPADTYSNTMMLSVVSSPAQMTFAKQGVTIMQQMTPAVCDAVSVGQEAQLEDIRDGKFYWVAKLADGKCWMTQNLDLDLSTKVALTPADSDVKENWAPGFDTAMVVDKNTINASSLTETRSWSLGDYRIINPTDAQSCGSPLEDVADCPGDNATEGLTTNRFTAYATPTAPNKEEDAHYIIGNHYQWNTATAGTGGSLTEGQATNSICPKGWKLPESKTAIAGTFAGLINAYSIGSNVAKFTSAPLYFVRGGRVNQTANLLFGNAGDMGGYWSSTSHSDGNLAYSLKLFTTENVWASDTWARNVGYSVRCIAR